MTVLGPGHRDYRCQGCGKVVASSTESLLYMNGFIFFKLVTFIHEECGAWNKWRPRDEIMIDEALKRIK